jgi:hypothetical protein
VAAHGHRKVQDRRGLPIGKLGRGIQIAMAAALQQTLMPDGSQGKAYRLGAGGHFIFGKEVRNILQNTRHPGRIFTLVHRVQASPEFMLRQTV